MHTCAWKTQSICGLSWSPVNCVYSLMVRPHFALTALFAYFSLGGCSPTDYIRYHSYRYIAIPYSYKILKAEFSDQLTIRFVFKYFLIFKIIHLNISVITLTIIWPHILITMQLASQQLASQLLLKLFIVSEQSFQVYVHLS